MTLHVTHSIMDSAEIGRLVEAHTNIGEVSDAILYRSWANEVYLITDGKGSRYYFKLARKAWRSVEDVRWQADLECFLSDRGAPIVRPIQVLAVQAPEGTRAGLLYREAPGNKPPPYTADLYEAFGRYAANLHATMDDFTEPSPQPPRDVDWFARKAVQEITSVLPMDEPAADIAREVGDWLERELTHLAPVLDFGSCHGDLTLDNLTVDKDGVITFFDFDLAGYGFRGIEFAGLYSWSMEEPTAQGYWSAFLAGYRERRAFSKENEDAMGILAVANELWTVAHEVEHWRKWSGLWRMDNDRVIATLHRIQDLRQSWA